jgi:hypothetical protein
VIIESAASEWRCNQLILDKNELKAVYLSPRRVTSLHQDVEDKAEKSSQKHRRRVPH